MKEIKCKHIEGCEDSYIYVLSDNEQLALCTQCNLNLSGEIMKQVAVQSLLANMDQDMGDEK